MTTASALLTDNAALPRAAALVRNAREQRALRRALAGIVDIDCCFDAVEAVQHLDGDLPDALIVHRFASNALDADRLVREFVARAPDVPVVVVLREPASRLEIPNDAVRLAQPIAPQIRAVLRVAMSRERARERRAAAGRLASWWAPEPARDAVRIAIEHGHRRVSVPGFANLNGLSRKAFDRYLLNTSPMTARELIVWGRLVSVAIALEDPTVTVAAIVPELGFSSPSALRNLLQRHTGLTPSDLRRAGGASAILSRLRIQLSRPPRA